MASATGKGWTWTCRWTSRRRVSTIDEVIAALFQELRSKGIELQ
ncbi:hypothetical protein ACFYYM_06310 [Streptomyces erythrochromogenes]